MAILPEGFEVEKKQGPSLPAGFEVEQQQPDFPGAAVIEPVRAIASGLARTIGGGVVGAAQAISPFGEEGAGARIVKEAQAGAFQPETAAGQEGLETLNTLVQKGIDLANIPLSGIGGIIELVSGQGVDRAVETIKAIQGSGVSKAAGARTLDVTDSPLAATVVETALAGGGELLALKGAGRVAGAAATRGTQAAGQTLPAVVETGKEVAQGLAQFQSPAKRRIAQLIQEGSNFKELAKFELAAPDAVGKNVTSIERFFDTKGPKVKADVKATAAVKQGFREGVIQPVKNATVSEKGFLRKMTDIAENAKRDELFGLENRPGDVAGDVLTKRLDVVRLANKRAGKRIGAFVKTLEGKAVESRVIGQAFVEDLAEMGITISDDLQINFKGSVIENLTGPENAIRNIFNRMKEGVPDGKKLHDVKKFIDEQVTFGKNAEGLAGAAERALKSLRFNINRTLADTFPKYGEANKAFSETITALDAFQDVAGKKMNLLGDNADKATGTLMRRLMGNAQSRITLLDSLDGIDEAVAKFGGFGGPLRIEGKGGSKTNLKLLVLYADELDRVFGAAPRTSLQGQFDQALGTAARAATGQAGAVDVAIGAVGKVVEKAQGINEEGAFKAIKELLRAKK
jgi:hypothetical protein